MDDFAAGADLCEDYRLLDPARLLRAMAGPGGKVYLVAERGTEYNDSWHDILAGDGEFRAVFADREAAAHAADLRQARKLRDIYPTEFGGPSEMSSIGVAELEIEVGRILGMPFNLRSEAFYEGSRVFPEWATDEQMIAIARLFDKMQFFHVIEAEFGG